MKRARQRGVSSGVRAQHLASKKSCISLNKVPTAAVSQSHMWSQSFSHRGGSQLPPATLRAAATRRVPCSGAMGFVATDHCCISRLFTRGDHRRAPRSFKTLLCCSRSIAHSSRDDDALFTRPWLICFLTFSSNVYWLLARNMRSPWCERERECLADLFLLSPNTELALLLSAESALCRAEPRETHSRQKRLALRGSYAKISVLPRPISSGVKSRRSSTLHITAQVFLGKYQEKACPTVSQPLHSERSQPARARLSSRVPGCDGGTKIEPLQITRRALHSRSCSLLVRQGKSTFCAPRHSLVLGARHQHHAAAAAVSGEVSVRLCKNIQFCSRIFAARTALFARVASSPGHTTGGTVQNAR